MALWATHAAVALGLCWFCTGAQRCSSVPPSVPSAVEAWHGQPDRLWDNGAEPLHHRRNTMPTTIKQADLIESIAAALQYIS
ncbi:hypothetical protein WG922_07780 [Ramlibacter sp. AN1015]|uniref:hypothetical protein n=1 Tax=Ramlibacter sp. AN1015 TaxID=3133428 RepID=UPI0030BDCBA4